MFLCFVVVVVVVVVLLLLLLLLVLIVVVVHQFYVCGKAQFNFGCDEQIYE